MPFLVVLFILFLIVVFWGWELVAVILLLTIAGILYWQHIKDKPINPDPDMINLDDINIKDLDDMTDNDDDIKWRNE